MPVYTGDKFGFGKSPDDGGTGAGPGEAFFPEPGQYDWVCPEGVTKVCAVCIGGGGGATRDEMGGGGGGGLGYKNNIIVTPGQTYKIQVGAGGINDTYMNRYGPSGGDSWFINATTVKGGGGGGTGCAADGDHSVPGYGGRGGTYVGDGGGNGGNGGDGNRSSINGTGADTGGGGAGGYGGDGGQGGDYNGNWNSGTAGNAGGGGGGCTAAGGSNEYWGGGGGGVSVYGKGRNGGTGSNHQHDWQSGGIGGSGGAAGWGNGGHASGYGHVSGGQFGGGGGSTDQRGGGGGSGAVRIIWGTGRAFPSTGCDDFWSETITRYTASSAEDTTATSSNWFRGGLGEEDNSNYSSNYNYNGIVPNISGHATLDGDLTIECWIYIERLADNTQSFNDGSDGWGSCIMDGRPNTSSSSSQLGSWWVSRGNDRRGSTGPYFINYNIEGGSNIQSDTECIQQCTWHHVAITRQSNYWWLWVDGVRVYTGSSNEGPGYNQSLNAQSDRPVIGGWGYGGRMHFWSYYGNISNFRITKNLALYDSTGTTYTVPTFPLTTTLPGQSGYFKVTQNNSSGHGSYIDLGADLITPNYQTYTVEVWCRPLQTPSGEIWVVDQHPSGNGRTIIGGRSGNLGWFSGGWYTTSTSFGNTTDWAHLAFVANNGNIEIFKNGISVGSQSGHITAAPPSQNTLWGQDTSYGQSGCEYRGFRINSNALYTSNFTPPSIDGGLTNISGTLALWDGLTGSAYDASGNNTWSATNMTFSPVGGSGATVEVLCCGVDDDYEKDLTGSRVWSGPNCMPSVLGPGEPTSEVMKKGYRIWGRHRGLGGGTEDGMNGGAGDGGLLSTWKKSTGSFQTEQFGTHGGWSAGTNNADGIAIKVTPNGAYATGDNASAKWNLKSISYGVPTYRPRNNSLGFGPFIPNVQIRVIAGKDMDGTIVYDSQAFTLRLPSYNHWDSNSGTPSKERYTSCAFEIELPNGGANDLDMGTWYSIFLKGMEHPNNNNWNSTNGTPGANKQNFWYPESPVSYSNNSGSFNLMRYAPSTSGDSDDVEVRLEQASFGGSWASQNHGSFNPLGQYPFFGISMPINFMKDPIPTGGGGGGGVGSGTQSDPVNINDWTAFVSGKTVSDDGKFWITDGSTTSETYVIFRDGGWIKVAQMNANNDVMGSSEINPSGSWIDSEINTIEHGKLASSLINAISHKNFLLRVTGSPNDPFLNNRQGSMIFKYVGSETLPNWGTSQDPTGTYDLCLDHDNSGTGYEIMRYQHESRTLCSNDGNHPGNGSYWVSDHNYNGSWQNQIWGASGAPICWTISNAMIHTNQHWMGGPAGGSGSNQKWGDQSNNATAIYLQPNPAAGGGATHVTSGLIFNVDASDSSSYPGTGNTWTDIEGSNNVSLTNCSYTASNGGGITFDGVSQWSIGEFTTPFTANQVHTWEVWTNGEWTTGWPGSPYTWILHNSSQGQSTGSSYMTIGINDANQFFGANDGKYGSMNVAAHTSTNSITYHLVLTWDGSTQKFYVNGTLGNSYSLGAYSQWQNNASFNTTTTMGEAIGGNYRPLKGNIYSVRCWNRALTAAEVNTNWNGNKAKFGH